MAATLRDRKKARTRREIARAAFRLFAKGGYAETTLADVAAAAEVGERTLFRYFADKEELLFAEDDEVREAVVEALAARPESEPPAAALAEALVGLAARWQERREEGIARQAIIDSSAALAARERGKHTVYEEALATGLVERGLSPEPAQLLARVGVACQHQATLWWFGDPDPRDPGLEPRCRDAFAELSDLLGRADAAAPASSSPDGSA